MSIANGWPLERDFVATARLVSRGRVTDNGHMPESICHTRRTLLTAAAGLPLMVAMAPVLGSPGTLGHRAIPGSGETLPLVGLGTWRTFSLGQAESSRAVLERFARLGGRLVDTSPMYGDAERALGSLSGDLGLNEQLFMATKVWTSGRQSGLDQINQSMKRMGRKVMDLIQVHNLVDWRIHLASLRALKDEGRVRYVGVTHYLDSEHDALETIVQREPIDFVQVNYNILDRHAENSLLPAAQDRGVAVIVNRPYREGRLFSLVRGLALPPLAAELGCESWGQFFLKFILSHPAVTCAIPATSKVHHLEDNLGAARGPLPDARQREAMAAFMKERS